MRMTNRAKTDSETKPADLRSMIKEAKEKRGLRRASFTVANLALPLLEPNSFAKKDVNASKEALSRLVEIDSELVKRPTLFDTLCALDMEPVYATDTLFGKIVGYNLPLRTIAEAWDIAVKHEWLLKGQKGAIIRNGLHKIYGSKNADVESIVYMKMFEAALYWVGNRGKYTTYVFEYLKSCKRDIHDEAGLIRFPPHVIQEIIRFKRFMERPGATREAYADMHELPMARVDRLAEWSRMLECSIQPVSLSGTADSRVLTFRRHENSEGVAGILNKLTMDQSVIEKMETTSEDLLTTSSLTERAQIVLKLLNRKYANVLSSRYGIESRDEGKTRGEVAKELQVTREIIHEIEAKALHYLRHPKLARHLRGFVKE